MILCSKYTRVLTFENLCQDKLYPAGTLIWMVRDAAGGEGALQHAVRCVDADSGTFARVVFSLSMISDHLLSNYKSAVSDLAWGRN